MPNSKKKDDAQMAACIGCFLCGIPGALICYAIAGGCDEEEDQNPRRRYPYGYNTNPRDSTKQRAYSVNSFSSRVAPLPTVMDRRASSVSGSLSTARIINVSSSHADSMNSGSRAELSATSTATLTQTPPSFTNAGGFLFQLTAGTAQEGVGTYRYECGDVFTGSIRNRLPNGRGTLVFARNGAALVMDTFQNGLPHGIGKYILSGVSTDVEYRQGAMVRLIPKHQNALGSSGLATPRPSAPPPPPPSTQPQATGSGGDDRDSKAGNTETSVQTSGSTTTTTPLTEIRPELHPKPTALARRSTIETNHPHPAPATTVAAATTDSPQGEIATGSTN